jgi:hypothetical protein
VSYRVEFVPPGKRKRRILRGKYLGKDYQAELFDLRPEWGTSRIKLDWVKSIEPDSGPPLAPEG